MESDLTQSALFYKLWAWGDKNRKQLLWGLIALIVVGIGVAFWLAHQSEKQNEANDALSKLTSQGVVSGKAEPAPDAMLKVATDYPDTAAGQRALLLGAASLFDAGKYDEAQARFQQFIKDNSDSPFVSQAAYGIAASLDAEGKTNDAVSSYQSIVDRYQNQNVAPQAKLALARLLEGQGKFSEARNNLEDILRSTQGTTASEAAGLLEQLNAAHPEPVQVATNRPTMPVAPVLRPTTP
jgi:TolA-binding protein